MGNALSTVLSKPVLAVGIPLVGGMAIGLSMRDDIKTWYPTIKKPSWNPPNAIFGPVWTVLYCMMGWGSYRIATSGGNVAVPLTLYAAQLGLNFLWSGLFFKKHDLKAASYEVTALVGTLAATIVSFHKIDPTAAYLLVPYLGWTSFATALTWDIYNRNKAGNDLNDPNNNKEGSLTTGLLDSVQGIASDATAASANVFLRQSNEVQRDDVPSTTED